MAQNNQTVLIAKNLSDVFYHMGSVNALKILGGCSWEKDINEKPRKKKERITEERKNAQTSVDTAVKKAVDAVPMLKKYLQSRFALKSGDKPHLMKF